MYIPPHFEEKRIEVLHQLMHAHAFGTLVSLGSDGLDANHLPFELDPHAGPFGTLRAHVARGNPVWRDHSEGLDTLAIFQGAHAYITPSWYATKRESGKVVPTYNYLAVHAYGPMRVIDDPVWLRGLINRLTDRHEAGRPDPWRVADAPDEYIDAMVGAIVGIEIPIVRLIGKWKISQNRSDVDRAGVVAGLRDTGDVLSVAMADAIRRSDLLRGT
ncbi:MAG TPA: FMN-binding negative transcriptional regulator [Paucimonas sp.]|nr:FMN-binding negative transcriptional regulator [Paucimonas sp.]HJW55174.1 FMN-binding negative transcriptional regulator [Burkholderiaceae bacterium]